MRAATHITTFYSFKGGVGRTLLLANVGVSLARRGRKVLLWDLDVEAPGMHVIPALTPQPVPAQGFLEWLLEWQEKRRMVLPPSPVTLNELYRRVRAVPRVDGLSILPAFGERADSARLYQDIRWHDFLVEEPANGFELFRSLLNFLGEKGGYDHILMDARTGITDLGGLMTAVLPHATVLVANYGAQNLQGIVGIEEALRAASENRIPARAKAGLPALNRLLVISPVPGDQDMLRAARKLAYDELFPLGREETRIEIPFDSRLLFAESVLALEEPESKIAGGYVRVAERIEEFRVSLLESLEETERVEIAYEGVERFRDVDQRHKKGLSFEDRVARLLTLLGYRVEREQLVDGNRIDLIASRMSGLRRECYLVECKDHRKPLGKTILERFRTWLDGDNARNMRAEGMVVGRGFSAAALSYAKSQEGLFLYTIEDLEKILFDFGPYLTRIRRTFEESGLDRTYVEQRVRLENAKEIPEGEHLLSYAVSWAMSSQGRRLWLLLGDYGTGKTTFFKRFAYELAKAQDDPSMRGHGYPVPIAIDLKEFPNAVTLEGLLQEHMRKHMDWHGNPAIFLYLLDQGKVVLLFDAFDEMGAAAIGRSVEDQFRQLAGPATRETTPGGNRILITCRTHFFRDQQIVKDVLHGAADDLVSRESPLGRLARTFDAEMDELMLFNDAQIDEFLRKHLSRDDAAKASAFIKNTYDLPRLAPRPVLLEMIANSLPELMRTGGDVTPSGLYHRYTSHWLDEKSGRSLQTTPQQRKLLLEFLAHELWGRSQNRIHHRELMAVLQKLPSCHLAGLDLDRVDLELRTAAFLIRTNEGFYSFSHRSFLEFFLARRILRALRDDENALAAVLDTAALTPECISFLFGLFEGEADWGLCRILLPAVLSAPYRPGVSENGLRLAYRLAQSKVKRAEGRSESEFGDMVGPEMRALMPERAQLQTARFAEEYLSEACLRGADMEGADLQKCDLSFVDAEGAIFQKAKMDRARLDHAKCAKADFSRASLKWVSARFADFGRASFHGSDLTAVVFVDALCASASFREACCHAARFARSNLWEAEWERADLTRFTAPDAVPSAPGRILPPEVEPVLHMGHRSWVRSAVFCSDGKRVLTAGSDGTARIWDGITGQEILALRGHEGPVNSAIFSPDGKRVLTAGDDGTARIWDGIAGLEIFALRGHEGPVRSAVFSSDGKRIVTVGSGGTARIWDGIAGLEILALRGHEGPVRSAVFSLDGTRVLTAGLDRTARIWDGKTGLEILALRGHEDWVNSAVFSSDGKRVLTAGSDGTARIWDGITGLEILALTGHEGWVNSAVFSSDGKRILTAGSDGTARIWDGITSREILALTGHEGSITSAVFSSDGKRVLTVGLDATVRIWDGIIGQEILALTGRKGSIRSAVFSSDGKRVLTAGSDGTVRIWDGIIGRKTLALTGRKGSVRSAVFSSDGKRVLTAGSDGTARIWDGKTGREILALTGHEGWVNSAVFSPDGKRVLTAGDDGTVRIWDGRTGWEVLALTGHEGWVRSAVFSSDGKRVLTAGLDGTARIWDGKTGREVLALRGHRGSVYSAVFSSDGKRVLTAGLDGTARIWHGITGREILALRGHEGWVNSPVFSSDGKWVLTAGDDGIARIWDGITGQEMLALRGHEGWVNSAVFSSDGKRVLTAGDDGTARIWDAQRGNLMRILLQVKGGWLTLDAQGRYLGEGAALDFLSYFDPEERSLLRTLWSAEDLPRMRATQEDSLPS